MNAPRRCVADFLPSLPEDDPVPRMIEGGLAAMVEAGHKPTPLQTALIIDLAMLLGKHLVPDNE